MCYISPIYLFLLTNSFLFSFIKHSSALSKMRCWQYYITNAPLSICLSLLLLLSQIWNSSRERCNAYISLSFSLSPSCSYHRLPLPLPLCTHFPPPSVFSLSTSPVAQGDGGRKADAFLFYLPIPAGTHLKTPEEKTTLKQYLFFPVSACETTWILLARNFPVLRTDFHPGLLWKRKHLYWSPAFRLTLHWELRTFSDLTGGQFWCFSGDAVVLK